jgi:exonuclease VII large subunit
MAIMERGYSIVRHAKTGKVIRKAADLRMGDSVLIELWKGKLKARL